MTKTMYLEHIDTRLFTEYKKADSFRQKEIVEEVYKIIRSINTFPEKVLSFDEKLKTLKYIANINTNKLYKDNTITTSSRGQSLCYEYYPNIWDIKRNRVGTRPISMRESFYLTRDLKRAIKQSLTYDSDISTLRRWIRMSDVGYGMNFSPVASKIIYDTNLNDNSKVLDYSAGFGGRLLGAWGSDKVSEYVGIEPNTQTYQNALDFSKFLNTVPNLENIEFYSVGSEDFTIEKYPQYKGYFDMAFSSPPYFDLEQYCEEETQSYIKYPNYKEWVMNYLLVTIHNCIDMLKDDGIFAINMYNDTSQYCRAPKIESIIKSICFKRGYLLYKTDYINLAVRRGNGSDRKDVKEKLEPIWYFKSKEDFI